MKFPCWHKYEVHQYGFRADVIGPPWVVAVIAWKQCRKCGNSKLIHILV